MTFKLTYSTMFDPPEEMHSNFESALAEIQEGLGAVNPMYIGGEDVAWRVDCLPGPPRGRPRRGFGLRPHGAAGRRAGSIAAWQVVQSSAGAPVAGG